MLQSGGGLGLGVAEALVVTDAVGRAGEQGVGDLAVVAAQLGLAQPQVAQRERGGRVAPQRLAGQDAAGGGERVPGGRLAEGGQRGLGGQPGSPAQAPGPAVGRSVSAATAGAERAAPPISATARAVVTIRRMVPLVVVISEATLTRRRGRYRSAMCSMIAVVEMAGVRSR